MISFSVDELYSKSSLGFIEIEGIENVISFSCGYQHLLFLKSKKKKFK